MSISTPVLLIGFNRADTMQLVFDQVRLSRPTKLYYAVDGPRNTKPGELAECQRVKDIVRQVDWPCEVFTRFSEENQGCGFGPYNAITWAFENEESLIVLEDDCVPVQSFFAFCQEMLERYKDDERITIVSGRSHHHDSKYFEQSDYIFSRYAHTWGWATWKRSWAQMDMIMQDVPIFLAGGGYQNIVFSSKEALQLNELTAKKYDCIQQEVTHSWDSQWYYARTKNNGLGIVPCRNLIRNVGSGNGTHTGASFIDIETQDMPKDLRHPSFICVNREYEEFHFSFMHPHISLLSRIKTIINKIIH